MIDVEIVEDFGDVFRGEDGGVRHCLHTWDDGCRMLVRCNRCGAYFLHQWSEFHGSDDSYYSDYFPVSGREEAVTLNEKYDGFKIESCYQGLWIWKSNSTWNWNKEDFSEGD